MNIIQDQDRYLVIIPKDRPLVESLTEVASKHNLQGGCLSGLGALKDVELGFYDLEKKAYLRKRFDDGDFELISLNGNISLKEGKPFIHVHAALGDKRFNVIGGHLFEAKVAVTAEISIIPLGKMPKRELDAAVGLALICGAVD